MLKLGDTCTTNIFGYLSFISSKIFLFYSKNYVTTIFSIQYKCNFEQILNWLKVMSFFQGLIWGFLFLFLSKEISMFAILFLFTWALHCYPLLVTIFLLIMFPYDYQ
jgi:hypothetical protein